MPGPRAASRADIVRLLVEGHSDRHICRALRTGTRRVAVIRAEYDIPRSSVPALTVEQKWATYARPTSDGHMAWTGYLRDGTTAVLKHCGEDHTARQVAFRIANGRAPEGRVLAGCGWRPCVAPAHMEDALMRHQYTVIFGSTT